MAVAVVSLLSCLDCESPLDREPIFNFSCSVNCFVNIFFEEQYAVLYRSPLVDMEDRFLLLQQILETVDINISYPNPPPRVVTMIHLFV